MALRKESLVEKEQKREDLGFGTKATSESARLMRPDGSFNVRKLNQSLEARLNIYHRLVRMPWFPFFVVISMFYLEVNLVFGTMYYMIGVENLSGVNPNDGLSDFWEAFFFSSQTLTTVGYGHISPQGYLTSFLASIEALIGLMIFAIMTGLLYGRFSRPNPMVIFSKNAIISPYLDITGLMFRMVNEKTNQLMNVEVNIILSRNETDEDGSVKRRYYTLGLERQRVKFFSTVWTVVHPITEKSILYKETPSSLKASDTEFIIAVEGINDTMTDPVHARKSYLYNEIIWGAKFDPILEAEEDQYVIDLSRINEYTKVNL